MLSREDAILGELLVARRHLSRTELASSLAGAGAGRTLLSRLVTTGRLTLAESDGLARDAAALDRMLRFEAPPDDRLGDFKLVREIGRGGMGVVFEAVQEGLGRRVAVKVLPSGMALDERRAQRFLREARVAARVRHPGLVPVYACGRAAGVFYFAMEHVDGRSLEELVAAGPCGPREASRLVAAMADAVAHLHANGVVHRDIKPSNVLLDGDGNPRITDFGLVHELDGEHLTVSATILGTPAYLAPEALAGARASPLGDVYGLGAVLYALLAGQAPYGDEPSGPAMLRLLTEPPAPLASVRPGLPPALTSICERAMARDPARRHRSASALADDLRRFLARVETAPPRSRVPALGIAAGVAAALVAAALGVALWPGGEPPPAGSPGESLRGAASAARTAVPGFVARAPGAIDEVVETADGALFVSYSDGAGAWPLARRADDRSGWELIDGNKRFFDVSPADGTMALGRLHAQGARVGPLRWRRPGASSVSVDPAARLAFHWTVRFSPDGSRVAFADAALREASAGRGILVLDRATSRFSLLASDRSRWIDWSPDGRLLAVGSDRTARVFRLSDARFGPDLAAEAGTPVFVGPRRIAFVGRDRGGWGILAVTVDEGGRPVGSPEALFSGLVGRDYHLGRGRGGSVLLHASASGASLFSARLSSDRGSLAGAPRALPNRALPFGPYESARLAPGAGTLCWVARPGTGSLSVGRRTSDGIEDPSLLAEEIAAGCEPAFSPDGATLAVAVRDTAGSTAILVAPTNGGGLPALHRLDVAPRAGPVWSPEGKRLVWTARDGSLRAMSVDGTPVREPAADRPFDVADWSPDGASLVGTTDGSLAVLDLARGRVDTFGVAGDRPRFASDATILFADGPRLMAIGRAGGAARSLFDASPSTIRDLDVDPATGTLLLVFEASAEEIWRLTP